MTRSSQTRTPKLTPDENQPPAVETSAPGAPQVLVAFARLGAAIAAVARFPNQPVPEKLVSRISEAQAEVDLALATSDGPAFSGGESVYEDQWIKDTFENLDQALNKKFSDLNASLDERFKAIDGRLDALKPNDANA